MSAPVPTLASIAPTSVTEGSGAFTLTVNGTNFTSNSVVNWNAGARATTFATATSLTASISASDVATSGTAQVTVSTPAPGGGASTAATFTISAATTLTVGIVQLISTDSSGVPGNLHSFDPALSEDGRYVSFTSLASNLVASDTNGAPDTFLHDTCLGPSAPPNCVISTQRVSVDNSGNQLPNGATANSNVGSGNTVSGDGRFVVFLAQAGDVLSNPVVPVSTVEVLLRDTCTGQPSGCVPSTTLISADGIGGAGDASSRNASISRNGRVVTFISLAGNLASGTVTVEQFYAHDTCFGAGAGCSPTTYLVSTNTGTLANLGVRTGTVNADGRYAVFQTAASNLVANDTNSRFDIFLRDTCIGAPAGCTPSTILASPNQSGGFSTTTNSYVLYPSVSGDGRFVLFQSNATDIVSTNIGGNPQLFIRDTCIGASGACTPGNALLSAALDGTVANSNSEVNGIALLSNTGRYALFCSLADNLLPGVGVGACYAKDTCAGAPAGCTPQLKVVSVDAQGNVLLGAQNALGSDGVPSISPDGHFGVLERFDHGTNAIQAYLILTGF